uniref:Uncharacterized protein n=1 Tax=Arundo donax TaxID=35708 RepID=A0A0A9AGD5_ARUDO
MAHCHGTGPPHHAAAANGAFAFPRQVGRWRLPGGARLPIGDGIALRAAVVG